MVGDEDQVITCITWNVNGLNNKIKRGLVFQYVRKLKPDFLLLQETHLLGQECNFLARSYFGNTVHAGFGTGSRGVAILIRKSLPFKQRSVLRDKSGRFIKIEGTLNGRDIAIVNIYAPPPLTTEFLTEIQPLLLTSGEVTLLVGGDFNAVMDQEIDRSRGRAGGVSKLRAFIDAHALVDVWRAAHTGGAGIFLLLPSAQLLFPHRLLLHATDRPT